MSLQLHKILHFLLHYPIKLVLYPRQYLHLWYKYHQNVYTDSLRIFLEKNDAVKPAEIIRIIESSIINNDTRSSFPIDNKMQYKNISDLSLPEWLEHIGSSRIFVVFCTETIEQIESSFGHVSIYYENSDLPYFNNLLAFIANEFSDPITAKTNINDYLSAAFSQIPGKVIDVPYFDYFHKNAVQEGRTIVKYELNLKQDEKIDFNSKIWLLAHTNSAYNFFTANCSSELVELILDVVGHKKKSMAFSTPVSQLRFLIDNNIITYHNASYVEKNNKLFKMTVNNSEIFNAAKRTYYHSIGIGFSGDKLDLETELFASNRPLKGMSFRDFNITLLKILAEIYNGDTNFYLIPIGISIDLNILKSILGISRLHQMLIMNDMVINDFGLGIYTRVNSLKIKTIAIISTNSLDEPRILNEFLLSNYSYDLFIRTNISKDFDMLVNIGIMIYLSNQLSLEMSANMNSLRVGFKIGF